MKVVVLALPCVSRRPRKSLPLRGRLKPHPLPIVVLGLDPGTRCTRESQKRFWLRRERLNSPLPRSKNRCGSPGQARGQRGGKEVSHPQRSRLPKNLSPPPQPRPYSPSRPRTGRMRNERVAGLVRVRWESSQRRPKADRWPDVDTMCDPSFRALLTPTSHRGNPEGQREGTGRLAEKVDPTFSVRPTDPPKTLNNPQPENAAISPKSRTHGAMVASYIQNHAERSSPHAVYNRSQPQRAPRAELAHAPKAYATAPR